jgi:hypothetical protein
MEDVRVYPRSALHSPSSQFQGLESKAYLYKIAFEQLLDALHE